MMVGKKTMGREQRRWARNKDDGPGTKMMGAGTKMMGRKQRRWAGNKDNKPGIKMIGTMVKKPKEVKIK